MRQGSGVESSEHLVSRAAVSEPLPAALLVPEQPEDELIRLHAERLIRKAGQLSLSEAVENPDDREDVVDSPSYRSLLEAVHAAAEGDDQARNVIVSNVRTDVIERTIKAGHVIQVELDMDSNGKLRQFGQSMEDVYTNSLRYASDSRQMRARTEAETRNGSRIEHYSRNGALEDHYFVVLSRAADDMSDKDMKDAGFFTDTMSCAIQVTTRSGNKLITESAFVAGCASPGSGRHDEAAVAYIGSQFGVNYHGKSATETLDMPMLVPKSLMPDGVIDVVRMYDEGSGLQTFFGQTESKGHYDSFRAHCDTRQRTFEPRVHKIAEELIAGGSGLKSPVDATRRLHELSQRNMVDQSIADRSIDARVFGETAAEFIEAARYYQAVGDIDRLLTARSDAQRTARSSSCPNGLKQQLDGENAKNQSGTGVDSDSLERTETQSTTIRCIKCRKFVSKKEVVKKDCWECPKCNHKVDICSGAVIREGESDADETEKDHGQSNTGQSIIAKIFAREVKPPEPVQNVEKQNPNQRHEVSSINKSGRGSPENTRQELLTV